MMKYKIYTISDKDGSPVYVGRTKDSLVGRLTSHKSHKSRVGSWAKNNIHTIEIVEETTDKSAEGFYISLFKSWGFNLLNIHSTDTSSGFYKECAKPSSKIVIDTQTGVFYESTRELERLLNVADGSIRRKLNGNRKNNTKYTYVY